MENIYEFFEIPKNASPEQIKKSFRKKSKKLHPDTGGNREEFENACKYYKILINPSSRNDYDNGNYTEKKDEKLEFILGVIFKTVEKYDPEMINIISKSKEFIRDQIENCNKDFLFLSEKKKKYKNFFNRIIEKNLENPLKIFIENHIKQIEIDINFLNKQIEFYSESLKFIEENYDYSISPAAMALDSISWVIKSNTSNFD